MAKLGNLLDLIAGSPELSAEAIRLFLVLLRDPFLQPVGHLMAGPLRIKWIASRLGMDPEALEEPASELAELGVVQFDRSTDTYALDLSKMPEQAVPALGNLAVKSPQSHRELHRNPAGQFTSGPVKYEQSPGDLPAKSRETTGQPDNRFIPTTEIEGTNTYCGADANLAGTSPEDQEPLEPQPELVDQLVASGQLQQGTGHLAEIPDAPMDLFPEPEKPKETAAQRRERQEAELAALLDTWPGTVQDAFADWRIAINANRVQGEARVGFMLRLAKEVDKLIPQLGDLAVAYGISQATTVPEGGPADNTGYVKKAARSYVLGQDKRKQREVKAPKPGKQEVSKYEGRA